MALPASEHRAPLEALGLPAPALGRLAATAIHVNTRFRSAEVGYLLSRSKADVLITQWDFGPVDFPKILGEVAAEDRAHLRLVIGRDASARDILGLPVAPLAPCGSAPIRGRASCTKRARRLPPSHSTSRARIGGSGGRTP